MRIRIKKLHPEAVVPRYAHFGDAAVDLVAVRTWEDDKGMFSYGTGLALEIPENHVGLLFPRSSIAKTSLRLANAVGVIDKIGDRIGQLILVPIPSIQFLEVNSLPDTDRGGGGFGSSGN
mgnify:CR=1 FL=1